jgi:hypothetical protein
MKYLKKFNESLEVREEWIKSVDDNVNWNLVEDIKDKAVNYLDQGRTLKITISRPTENLCIINHNNNRDEKVYQISKSNDPILVNEKDRIFYTLKILGGTNETLDTLEFCDEVKYMVNKIYPEEENNVGYY